MELGRLGKKRKKKDCTSEKVQIKLYVRHQRLLILILKDRFSSC